MSQKERTLFDGVPYVLVKRKNGETNTRRREGKGKKKQWDPHVAWCANPPIFDTKNKEPGGKERVMRVKLGYAGEGS